MTSWSKYFHDRLTNLEKQLFGPDEASRIVESAPANLPTDPAAPIASDPQTGPVMTPEGAVVAPEPAAEPAPTGPVIGPPEEQQVS